MPLEDNYDATFAAGLALQEKQIQQSYRPVIGVHKWFARRPGTLFRNLLLSEYNGDVSLQDAFYRAHELEARREALRGLDEHEPRRVLRDLQIARKHDEVLSRELTGAAGRGRNRSQSRWARCCPRAPSARSGWRPRH